MPAKTPTHASRVHDEERLNAYLQRGMDLRVTRAANVSALIDAIGQLEVALLEKEKGLTNLMVSWGQVAVKRPGAMRRLWIQWEPPSGGYPLGPVGPSWFIAEGMDPPARLKRPTRRMLTRIFAEDGQARLQELVWELFRLQQSREKTRKQLSMVFRALAGTQKESPVSLYQAPEWVTDKMAPHIEARHEAVARLQEGVKFILSEVEALEWSLDQSIASVNEQGRRRHNVIVAKWDLLRGDFSRTVTGMSGPYFHLLRMGRRGGRYLELVKGKVTRELVRECFQARYEEKLMPLIREIEQQATERKALNGRLVTVQRTLGLQNSNETGDDDGEDRVG